MDEVPQTLTEPSASGAHERSLVDDVKLLFEDGRTLVEAELAYQKSRAAAAGSGIKGVAGWTALALALVFCALLAVVTGLLLGLAGLIGIWLATLAVVLTLLVCAGLCALAVSRRWQRMSAQLSATDETA